MKNKISLLICLLLLQLTSFAGTPVTRNKYPQLRVLQFNTWSEGAPIKGGREGIMKAVESVHPDIVLFQEVRGQKFIDEVIAYFKEKGITYYGRSLNISTAFLSKYPIQSVRTSEELGKDSYAFVKAIVTIQKREFAFYSMHLDWKHLAYYNVRGFDGHASTYPYPQIQPMANVTELLAENDRSRRPKEVSTVIADAQKEIAQNRIVILGGDFNEPSFQDWKKNTRKLRNHNRTIVPWTCSVLLDKAGFVDCYRSLNPNAVTHPGFTCNAGNKHAKKEQLYWSYGIDDRERIDHNFYHPDKRIKLIDAIIIGPKEDFWDGRVQYEATSDRIYTPNSVWPSDHKAVLTVYELR